jgi:hypothetical protein
VQRAAFFWDPPAPQEQGTEFFSPPMPRASIFFAAANSVVRLSRMAKSAAMEDRNELFLEYRQGDRTAD